jgi:hypothetical protein
MFSAVQGHRARRKHCKCQQSPEDGTMKRRGQHCRGAKTPDTATAAGATSGNLAWRAGAGCGRRKYRKVEGFTVRDSRQASYRDTRLISRRGVFQRCTVSTGRKAGPETDLGCKKMSVSGPSRQTGRRPPALMDDMASVGLPAGGLSTTWRTP